MSSKAILYLIVTVIVTWSLDSVNREIQARVFYLLLDLCLIYLITNFIWDFFLTTKIN